jgi:3-hydroxy-9,10-secoandrosta-1,3,5(10)-triene-9,17-dione monooxygenase reductase component
VSSAEQPGETALPAIDTARFRQVLGHFATGVTIVTASVGSEPGGLTVNAFASVSLDPPLVLFCVTKVSSTWPRIRDAGDFCVNVLADDQEDIARVFSESGVDRFRGIGWKAAESGAPVIAGVLAWLDCTVETEHDGGDHLIVVGRVRDLEVAREGEPLIFYRGGYGTFQA